MDRNNKTKFFFYKSYQCENNTECRPISLFIPSGIYKVELWGARSGIDLYQSIPAKGAYVSGDLLLRFGRTFNIYLGGVGSNWIIGSTVSLGGWNGGGSGYTSASGGGGASDIRLTDSLQSRIIVAAGAGGGEHSQTGHGGDLNGVSGQYLMCGGKNANNLTKGSTGGTQIAGGKGGSQENEHAENGKFGYGGNGTSPSNGSGGGGGGYFGGGGVVLTCSASGGSSYISGHPNCYSVKDETSETMINTPFHYSGLYFTNTLMKKGNQIMPLPGENYTEGVGNDGPGAVRITFLSPVPKTGSFALIRLHLCYHFYIIVLDQS